MDPLDEGINALRDYSEDAARGFSGQADRALGESGAQILEELFDAKRTLTAIDAPSVGDTVARILSERVAPQLSRELATAPLRGLELFSRIAGTPSPPAVQRAVAEGARLASQWVTGIPRAQAIYAEQIVSQAIMEPVSTIQIVDQIRQRFAGETSSSIRTLVETTLHNTDQLVIDRSTEATGHDYGLDAYVGPDDRLARRLCHHMVNQIFLREALRQCQNGQLPDFMLTRGGYNCRHRRRPTTRTQAKYLKMQIVEPYRMVTEIVSAEGAKVVRSIVYPVLDE